MPSSVLLYASSFFVYVTICPSTLILFILRYASRAPAFGGSARVADFHATLMFGVFTTLAGVFGLVAESLDTPDSRWWFSASYAAQAVGVLVVQLAVIQLLAPEYLPGLLLLSGPSNQVPSWRIYALAIIAILASVCSIVSSLAIPFTPSLASSIPTFVSACLPIPILLPIAHTVRANHIKNRSNPIEQYIERNSKCTELELTAHDDTTPPTVSRFPRIWDLISFLQCVGVIASLFQVIEAAIGRPVPTLRLFSAVASVVWGGGVMTTYLVVHEPVWYPTSEPLAVSKPSHDLERLSNQPSEDFMTLRDPFASPTQVGHRLPPSPPTNRRKPKRRASEPLQLTRFGSLSGLHAGSTEQHVQAEFDPDARFLEELVRHALFGTAQEPAQPSSIPAALSASLGANGVSGGRPSSLDCFTRASTPTIRQKCSKEFRAPSTPEPAAALSWHPFRPSTPPSALRTSSRVAPCPVSFPEPPSSFPFSSLASAESVCSIPLTWSRPPSGCAVIPSSSSGSDSGSSFVSPPPTPTPVLSRSKSKVHSLAPLRLAPAATLSPARRRESGPA